MRLAPLYTLSLAAALAVSAPAFAGDWSHWRGPNQNGVSPETDLPETFKPTKAGQDNLVWKAPYGCRSCPLVHNGRVFLVSHTGKGIDEQERVVCLDAKDGSKVWEHRFNMFHTDIVSARVGWNNLALDPASGNVYCHGTQGLLLCFNRDGKILWERSLGEEFGRISGYGGRLSSPAVDGDLVVVAMANASWGEYARGGIRLIAFDKTSGQVVWLSSTGLRVKDTFSSTPTFATINGVRTLLVGGGDGGIHGFKARTGEKLWSHVFAGGAVNIAPVVDGTRVYVAHGDVNPEADREGPQGVLKQGRVICVDAAEVKDGKPKLVWQVDGPKIKFGSPILHEGRLYLNDESAELYCLDAKDGTQLWTLQFGRGSNNRCSPVLADGKLYVSDASSSFYILKPEAKKCTRLHRQFFRGKEEGVDAEFDGSPAIADGRIYFASNEEIYCIGKPNGKQAGAGAGPGGGQPAGAGEPAFLQVVPAEVTVKPGEAVQFKARLYDDKGNLLRETKAEWSLAPMSGPEKQLGLPDPPAISPPPLKGELSADGKYTAPADVPGQFGNVVAKANGLTARARVRQVAKLPYKQDFEKVPVGGPIPGGWVNTQGKFQVRKVGDSNVLVKMANNASPLVARANAFLNVPTLSDYTVEADVMAKKVGDDQADVGVVANRYTLVLIGNAQTLRLISWDALPRIDKTVSYQWDPDAWYRLKLTVVTEGNKTTVKGKIWERGKEEPKEWTLEAEDPIPNKQGAPALFANATGIPPGGTGAEAFFDNVSVTPNEGKKSSQAPTGVDRIPPARAVVVPVSVESAPCRIVESRPRLLRWRR